MTTIAFDGKTLCVDSQASCGNLIVCRSRQKMWLDVGSFKCVAIAGDFAHMPPVVEWLREGANPADWREWDVCAWVITADNVVHRYVGGYPEFVNAGDAEGTGMELAIGAMAAGATAEEAVLIASRYDWNTGGAVHSYTVKQSALSVVK